MVNYQSAYIQKVVLGLVKTNENKDVNLSEEGVDNLVKDLSNVYISVNKACDSVS